MRLLLLFYMCFGFGEKFPTPLLQLLTLRTFYCTRARLTLEPSRLLCVLRFAFFLPPKANRKARRNFPPPRLWLKSGKCS